MGSHKHSADHYYYRTTLKGLEKNKIYFHAASNRYFFLTRLLDSLDRKSHFIEFYEIEPFHEEFALIDAGELQPIRRGMKKIYVENLKDFKKNFSRLLVTHPVQVPQDTLRHQCPTETLIC